jgi:hypothetical protein
MDASAFDECGKQLCDFLAKQIAPPPGAKCVLGFLGQGVAVDPDSFLSNGEFNLARVNAWLNIVAEPLGSVGSDDNRVDPVPFTAYKLMESVCNFSTSLAPAGSDAQQSFVKIKSQAMEGLGGATTVLTAPLDWYDPKHLPEWPKCSLATATTTASGTGSSKTPPTPPSGDLPRRPRLWAWRTLQNVPIADPAPVQPAPVPVQPMEGLGGVRVRTPMRRESMPVRAFQIPMTAAAMTTPVRLAPFAIGGAAQFSQRISVGDQRAVVAAVDRPSNVIMMEKVSSSVFVDHALSVSNQIAASGDQASTSTVDSESLTINLNYFVVQLSRDPWWNDILLLLDDWYIPGLQRGSIVGESGPENTVGVPIALVLTSNVQIEAKWSDADRLSASSHTHIGPWALDSTQFSALDSQGLSKLTIPGIQAVACIYRALPVIPPKAEQELPPP